MNKPAHAVPAATVVEERAESSKAEPEPAPPEKPKPTRQRIIDAVKLKDRAASHHRWADHKAKSGDCIRVGAVGATRGVPFPASGAALASRAETG